MVKLSFPPPASSYFPWILSQDYFFTKFVPSIHLPAAQFQICTIKTRIQLNYANQNNGILCKHSCYNARLKTNFVSHYIHLCHSRTRMRENPRHWFFLNVHRTKNRTLPFWPQGNNQQLASKAYKIKDMKVQANKNVHALPTFVWLKNKAKDWNTMLILLPGQPICSIK